MSFFETENISNENENHSLFVEKYRPTTLKDYIGNPHLKDKIESYLSSNDIPHLLLYGKAGTGKTTLAKLIVRTINCDSIIINASDENNIDTIRNKVKGFVSTVGFKDLKVVILDESDFLTPSAQAMLRNLMETFSKHCRFILTCNYLERIIDPVQSRCQSIQIIPPSKKDVAVHLAKILKNEDIQFSPNDVVKIIDVSYPDIRKIINTAQLNSFNGVLKLDMDSIVNTDIKSNILSILCSKTTNSEKYKTIRQLIADSRIQNFTEFYTFLFETVDQYAKDNTSNAILIISEGQAKDVFVTDKEIQIMATIIQLINLLK